jgi:hypothetical protein
MMRKDHSCVCPFEIVVGASSINILDLLVGLVEKHLSRPPLNALGLMLAAYLGEMIISPGLLI